MSIITAEQLGIKPEEGEGGIDTFLPEGSRPREIYDVLSKYAELEAIPLGIVIETGGYNIAVRNADEYDLIEPEEGPPNPIQAQSHVMDGYDYMVRFVVGNSGDANSRDQERVINKLLGLMHRDKLQAEPGKPYSEAQLTTVSEVSEEVMDQAPSSIGGLGLYDEFTTTIVVESHRSDSGFLGSLLNQRNDHPSRYAYFKFPEGHRIDINILQGEIDDWRKRVEKLKRKRRRSFWFTAAGAALTSSAICLPMTTGYQLPPLDYSAPLTTVTSVLLLPTATAGLMSISLRLDRSFNNARQVYNQLFEPLKSRLGKSP